MQDLKYEAITLDVTYGDILGSLNSSNLVPVTKAFITNLDRVYGLLRLPLIIPHMMGILVNAVLPAIAEIAGGESITVNTLGLQKLVQEMMGELVARRNAEGQLSPSDALDLSNAKLEALSAEDPESVRVRFLIKIIANLAQAVKLGRTADGRLSVVFP